MPSWLPPTDGKGGDRPLGPMFTAEHGGGAPVVLLHCQPGDSHDWDLVVDHLDGRARALVPDRPGYGRTGEPAGGIARNTDAVLGLLDAAGIDQATVAGFSWGGAVALDLAQRHPDRLRALVLVSSVGGTGSIDDLDRLLGAPVIGPLLSLGGLVALRVDRIRRLLGPRHAPADPVALDRLPDGWLRSWRSFVIEERALLEELPAITASLGRTQVPAVVMLGELDRVVRPRSQEAMASELPRAEVLRIPGCGHLLTREVPHLVADVIAAAAGAARDGHPPRR